MWEKIKKFFLSSETIFLARLQILIGALLEATAAIDPGLFSGLFGKWFPVFLIAHGALTEYLRKRRDPELVSRGR